MNKSIFEENFQELVQSKEYVSFNCDLITKFGEPKEMNIKLNFFSVENSFIIFGSAFNIENNILFKLCESENQVYKIENFLIQIELICNRVSNACMKYITHDEALELKLYIKELLVNSLEHGNLGISFEEKTESLANGEYYKILIDRQKDPGNINKKIMIEYSLNPEKVELRITDEGNGFDHKKMMTRTKNDFELNTLSHGRGIMMAMAFFDRIEFNEKGNSVYIVKNFKSLS